MSKLVAQGSKYGDEIRRKAVSEYSLCDSLAKVSESTGIPRKTLSDWRRSEWWDQLTAELRQDKHERVPAVEQIPLRRLVESGSQYTDVQRRRAAAEYCATGNLSATSRVTSIPRGTIQGWTKTDWWVQEVARVQYQISEQIQAQNMQIATKAGEQILDRLKNGDTVVVKGEKMKIPVKARDLSVVGGIAVDKTIQLGMPKSFDPEKSQSMADLLEEFREISRAIHRDEKVVAEQ